MAITAMDKSSEGQDKQPPATDDEPQSIDDALRAEFAAAEEADSTAEPEAAEQDTGTEDAPDSEEETADDDATGDDQDADDETEESDEEASDSPDEDSEDEPGEAITPPEHWSEGDKEAFESLPEQGKKFLLRRHKEMEADYTRKTTEAAPFRKALEPFRPQMQQMGINEEQAVQHITASAQQLWQYQQMLQQNPKQVIQQLAQQYGVTLGEEEQDSYVDPEVKKLQQEVTQTRASLQQFQQQSEQQKQAEINSQLEAFKADHPHFEDLRQTMAALMNAGQANSLEDAYEKAQWSHPEIREKILEAEKRKEREAAEKRRKEKQKVAKKNATSVSTRKRASTPAEPTSLEDDLREALNKT